MNRAFTSLFTAALLLVSSSVFAATVHITDGSSFNYVAGDTWIVDLVLTEEDPVVSFGVNVDPGEVFEIELTAPAEFGLWAMITTGPDFGGYTILSPNDYATVWAGTSYVFPLDGNYHQGETQWFTIEADTNDLATYYPDGLYLVNTGLLTTPSDVPQVPVPPAVWLFGSGLMGLIGFARRRK